MSSAIKHNRQPGEKTGHIDREMIDATTDADIDRQIAEDPDAAPDMSEWDLSKARLVKPLQSVEE